MAGIFYLLVVEISIGDEADSSPFCDLTPDLWNYTPPQSAGTPSPFGNVGLGAEQGAAVKNPP